MKKGIFLLGVIFALIGAWSAGWFFIADKIETTLVKTKTKLADKGRDIQCANQQILGYPFRLSLNCDNIRYADTVTGLTFEAGKLKTAAQVYQPNKAIVELSSPANVTLPNGRNLNTTWNSMRSSLKVGLSGPENLSVHGKELKLIPTNQPQQTMLVKDMQFHSRKFAENDINLALNISEAKSQDALWPSFNLNTVLLVEDTYKDVVSRTSILRVAKTKGLKGKIESFQYAPNNGGMLEVTGPAQVNIAGQLSGQFDVTVRDLPKLLSSLSESFPKEKDKFDTASQAISFLTQKSGKNELKLPITITNGSMKIGIIPLGKLPPLF